MYIPQPIDTSKVRFPEDLHNLVEMLAENAHENWAEKRIAEGWSYGPERNDNHKRHPDLVPFQKLSTSEKEYDRKLAIETIKVILMSGYSIEKIG